MKGKIMMMCAVLFMCSLHLTAGEDGSGRTKKLKIDQFLKPEKGGILRGVHFNMNREEVMEVEERAVQRRNKRNMLACRLPSSNDQNPDISYITYEFDKKRLKQILLRSYQKDDKAANKLYYNTLSLFDDLYGTRYENNRGKPYWQAIDDSSGIRYDITVSRGMENGRSLVELEYRSLK